MEFEVITPFMHGGQRVETGTVIDLLPSEGAYLVTIGRARRVGEADDEGEVKPAKAAAKPAKAAAKPAKKAAK